MGQEEARKGVGDSAPQRLRQGMTVGMGRSGWTQDTGWGKADTILLKGALGEKDETSTAWVFGLSRWEPFVEKEGEPASLGAGAANFLKCSWDR